MMITINNNGFIFVIVQGFWSSRFIAGRGFHFVLVLEMIGTLAWQEILISLYLIAAAAAAMVSSNFHACTEVLLILIIIIIIIFNQVQTIRSLTVKALIVKHMINACGLSFKYRMSKFIQRNFKYFSISIKLSTFLSLSVPSSISLSVVASVVCFCVKTVLLLCYKYKRRRIYK